ncbi:UNVERIFIED_CONTAM: hypothetical protein FKN15_052466 [Acipenser sinensis]
MKISGSTRRRILAVIPCLNEGYSAKYFRDPETQIGSAIIYVRPLQRGLNMDQVPGLSLSTGPLMKCLFCEKDFSFSEIKSHSDGCNSSPQMALCVRGLLASNGKTKPRRIPEILNELSSDTPGVPKIEEEKSEEEVTPSNIATMAVPTSIYQTSTGQYTATGDMPTYQIRTPTSSLPQGVVMAASPGSLHSPQQLADEVTRKREHRLMKNREAARECRKKKKEYVKCLENRVAVLENQNKTLIEELKALKDLYCHKTE